MMTQKASQSQPPPLKNVTPSFPGGCPLWNSKSKSSQTCLTKIFEGHWVLRWYFPFQTCLMSTTTEITWFQSPKPWCSCTFDPLTSGLPTTTTISPPPRDPGPWPMKRSEFSAWWQMHRYYIYNKYFVNNLATLFFYQKSFITNIVSKIQCIDWFNYKSNWIWNDS